MSGSIDRAAMSRLTPSRRPGRARGRAARRRLERRRPRRRRASRVVGVVRRSDGLVSMAPNLGWRDVPLGDALVRDLDLAVPVAIANEADLGALAEHRRGAAVGADHVLFISGDVGVGGGLIVDGKPLDRRGRLRRRGRPLPDQPGRRRRVAAARSAAGRPRSARGRCCGGPGGRRVAVAASVEAVVREAEAGSPVALAALAEVGRWLGIGLAGLVNVLNPEVIVLGRPVRPDPAVRGPGPRAASSTGGPVCAAWPRPGRPREARGRRPADRCRGVRVRTASRRPGRMAGAARRAGRARFRLSTKAVT